ncbi:MAG: peptide deformylase [Azospirillum sp.]|nr:peptide deformylase [Azospirillum sp.]
MSLLKIARMGHPVLRRAAAEVADPAAPDIQCLVADMMATMIDAPGVGLAAPQVHVGRRVIVFRVPGGRGGEAGVVPPTALINPVWQPVGDEIAYGWEGCLSIPGLRGVVPRHRKIRLQGLAPDGSPVDREAADFEARVLQHEIDHLDGILYLDRMQDLTMLSFEEELHHFDVT